MDLLDLIDCVHMGERDEDLLVVTAQGRRVLQEKFSGYFQNFLVASRRIKEAEVNARPKRGGHRGGRGGVNARRRRGAQLDGVGMFIWMMMDLIRWLTI